MDHCDDISYSCFLIRKKIVCWISCSYKNNNFRVVVKYTFIIIIGREEKMKNFIVIFFSLDLAAFFVMILIEVLSVYLDVLPRKFKGKVSLKKDRIRPFFTVARHIFLLCACLRAIRITLFFFCCCVSMYVFSFKVSLTALLRSGPMVQGKQMISIFCFKHSSPVALLLRAPFFM